MLKNIYCFKDFQNWDNYCKLISEDICWKKSTGFHSMSIRIFLSFCSKLFVIQVTTHEIICIWHILNSYLYSFNSLTVYDCFHSKLILPTHLLKHLDSRLKPKKQAFWEYCISNNRFVEICEKQCTVMQNIISYRLNRPTR